MASNINYQDIYKSPVFKVGVLFVLIIVLYLIFNPNRVDPDLAFKNMLNQSFSTKQVQTNEGSGVNTYSSNLDFDNQKNPEISSTQNIQAQTLLRTVDTWGDLNNSYVKFVVTNLNNNKSADEPYLNKWIVIRKDGQTQPQVDQNIAQLGNPNSSLIGPLLFGNLSSTDKTNLVNFALNNHIYNYDTKQVKGAKVGNNAALNYTVTLNKSKLIEYNKMYGNYMGLNADQVASATTALNKLPNTIQVYIDKGSNMLLQFVESTPNGSVTIKFTNYNNAPVSKEPTAQLTWSQYNDLLNAKISQTKQ